MPSKRILYASAIVLMLIITFLPIRLYAAETNPVETKGTETGEKITAGETVYVTAMTYFYRQPGPGDYYGKLKAGSLVTVEEIVDGYAKVTYAEEKGYISTLQLSRQVPVRSTETGTTTIETPYLSFPEMIYPSSHYGTKLDADANFLLIEFSTDEEDDNYVCITNGEDAVLYGMTISCLYGNGCGDATIYVQDEKDNQTLFAMKIPTWEASDDEYLNLSFTWENNTISFTGGDFGRDIYVGFKLEEGEKIVVAGETKNVPADEDGYAWVVATGQNKISRMTTEEYESAIMKSEASETAVLATGTNEVIQKEAHEDTETGRTKNTAVYICYGIALATAAVSAACGILQRKKRRRQR